MSSKAETSLKDRSSRRAAEGGRERKRPDGMKPETAVLRGRLCRGSFRIRGDLMMCKTLLLFLALATSAITHAQPEKRPFTFEDMMQLKRLSEPVPSPDGKWVVFAAQDVDLEANTRKSRLWIVPATGGDARRLNPGTDNEEERPRFSPDGTKLIFTSKATDPTQIWMCGFDPNSGALAGETRQVTNLSTGADGAIWSPDGKNILFVSAVYPECKDDACNKQRADELANSKVKAKVFTKLLYRHWMAFTEFKRSHLFVVSADADASQPNAARDITPGDHDVPPFNLGGQDLYAISPDGQEVAYTSNVDEVEATSTNNEIFLVPIAGGTPKKISTSPGNDNSPAYSPDGKHLAWRSMARAGFEADKERLFIYERASGKTRDATEKFDRSVGSYAWRSDSYMIYFAAEDRGEAPLYGLAMDGTPPAEIARLHADDLAMSPDGKALFFSRASIQAPNEIGRLELAARARPGPNYVTAVTRMNDAAALANRDAAARAVHVQRRG